MRKKRLSRSLRYGGPQLLNKFVVGWGLSDIRNKVIVRGCHGSHPKDLFVTYPVAVLKPVSSFPLKSLRFDGATCQWFAGSQLIFGDDINWWFLCFFFSWTQLPDLMHSETLQAEPVATFLLQNLGLVLGFAIMLIIALYEEDLMAINF